MDVNGTRFHLVFGRADWLGPGAAGAVSDARTADGANDVGDTGETGGRVEWNEESAIVALRAKQFIFPPRRGELPPAIEQRRGAARDRYGNWYWIDESRTRIA